jgi:hypothetical protein
MKSEDYKKGYKDGYKEGHKVKEIFEFLKPRTRRDWNKRYFIKKNDEYYRENEDSHGYITFEWVKNFREATLFREDKIVDQNCMSYYWLVWEELLENKKEGDIYYLIDVLDNNQFVEVLSSSNFCSKCGQKLKK